MKNFCDEKGLDYEIEMVNDKQDYFTKLQMYINSDTLPDILDARMEHFLKHAKILMH